MAALAGWAALSAGGGGIDPGDGLARDGSTSLFLALALGAPLAVAAATAAWNRPAWRSAPARLGLAAAAGIVAWSALSIIWAAGPDLAWLDANRAAISLCALAIGLALGALLPGAPAAFGLGLSLACLPTVALALGHKLVPGLLGSDDDLARLSEPVGYWNALALVVAMAVPGTLWLAATGPRRPWRPALAGAGIALLVTTLLLTYSRGGILATALAAGITIAALPRRVPALSALAAGAIGAALPSAFALRDAALSTDGAAVALREGPGAELAWRLAVGLALAAALAPALAWAWGRIAPTPRRARAIGLGALAAVVLAAGIGIAASASARDWVGDRAGEFRGEGGTAVANTPGRLVSASGNQRSAWWAQAWRGFEDAPLIGHGAGGFRLVQLQERRDDADALTTIEPHNALLRFLSGTGIVGAALFAALIGAIIWGLLRAAAPALDPQLGLPAAVLGAFALTAAVDWTWEIPAVAVPAMAAAGIVLARAAPGPPLRGRRPSGLAAGTMAALALAAIASAVLPWWSTRLVDSAYDNLAAGRPERALVDSGRARTLDPLSLYPLQVRASAYRAVGQTRRALGVYLDMTRVQPDNPASWRALARYLGDDPRAVPVWRQVRRLDPRDLEAASHSGSR